jgi:hypothetical protein
MVSGHPGPMTKSVLLSDICCLLLEWCPPSSTSGSRSVGIVRSRTLGHGVYFFVFVCLYGGLEN